MLKDLLEKRVVGVSFKEALLTLLIFFILSIYHQSILWLIRSEYTDIQNYFDFDRWFTDVGLRYIIMLLESIIVWLVIFRLCKKWRQAQRFLLHLFFLPTFVWCSQELYYLIGEWTGYSNVKEYHFTWAIYINTLNYTIVFSVFHAYEYHLINQKKLRLELELRQAALTSDLKLLKAQLNPHFLYNVFNTINASIHPSMEDTREMIADLSDMFRYQLKASKEDMVPLKDEIQFVKKYLKLEKRRFGDRLTVEYEIAENTLNELIPSMILQPIVENAIKHGISPLIEGGSVRLKVEKIGASIRFEVVDNGVGIENIEDVFEKGVGLSNTQLRLQKAYDSSLEITENDPSGVKICFTI